MTSHNLDVLIEREGMEGFSREYDALHAVVTLADSRKYLLGNTIDFAVHYFEAKRHNYTNVLGLDSLFERNHHLFPVEAPKEKFRRKQQFFDSLQQANQCFARLLKYEADFQPRERKAFLHLTAFDYVADVLAYRHLVALLQPEAAVREQEDAKIVAAYAGILEEIVADSETMQRGYRQLATMVNSSRLYPTAEAQVHEITAALNRNSETGVYLVEVARSILQNRSQPALVSWERGRNMNGSTLKEALIGGESLIAGLSMIAIPLAAATIWLAHIDLSVDGNPTSLSYLEGGSILAGSYVSMKGLKWLWDYLKGQADAVKASYLSRNKPLMDRIIHERLLEVLE